LSLKFSDLYDLAVNEEYEDGVYKDINYDKDRMWHEFRNGIWHITHVSLIDMLARMATLSSAVA
jgi:hypothetical protein